jgi:uncharacterized membrane protein
MERLLAVALTVGALLWTSVLLVVPVLSARHAAPVFVAMVHSAGGLVCHQRPERSFHVEGAPLPVCARCIGLYVSGTLGAVAAWIGFARSPRRARMLLAIAALPTAISFVVEVAGVGLPSNAVRAIAALPLGGAAGWLFVRMLRAESAETTCAMIS